MKKISIYLFVLVLIIAGCRRPQPAGNEVRIRVEQDPENLNPVSYLSKNAAQMINLLYQSLLTVDLADGKLKPLLAESMPTVVKQDSVSFFTYRIRPEATWDNGAPVTASDVVFSLKVIKCPLVNNEKIRPDFEFIQDIRTDAADPKKFTIVCKGFTPEHLLMSGERFFVMPEYIGDPKGLLKQFTLPQLQNNFDALTQDPQIAQFAEHFNSADFTRNPEKLQGSAGYQLENWTTGQQIQFKRKPDWWGNKTPQTIGHLTANPEKITFRIVPDNAAALVALKNGQLDVWQNVPATVFQQLRQDKTQSEKFQFFTPQTYSFVYLGLNGQSEKFSDPRTRRAIAHLLDLDAIIKTTQQNLAVKTVGPISPADKRFYNSQIQPYTYNVTRATELLLLAGWQKNGSVWQRKTNGEIMQLKLNIGYNASNSEYENIALIFQQAAAKAGIPVTLQPLENGVLSKDLKTGNFDCFIRSLTGNPFVFNFKPILHSESVGPDGLNYTGFSTPESDRLIEALYASNSEAEKAKMLKRLQEILHEESNLIFLFFQQDRIVVNKRFGNLKISGIKPGYDVSAFTLQVD
ncbi:ABC transporter substrate-binding protein [Adhaeribacter terreus]|uniref:ABC transporter substrate-binding protein n=1 Tax=Adhaeribacter terreus TaxID=529703 RepID=A0ABW0EDD0_9BACT